MPRFLNTMHDKMFKTFLYYFHSLPVVYHEVSTNLIILKLHLHFIKLKNISKSYRFSCLANKMFKNSTIFMDKVLKWTQFFHKLYLIILCTFSSNLT
jgi:hypothetical protein